MKQTALLVLNTATLFFMLIVNYLSGTGTFNNATVGEISARYENLFTPAGYAFVIWGAIYLLLIAFLGYQWYAWFNNGNDEYLKRTGIWFMLSNLANGFWTIVWTNDYIGMAFVLIVVLLVSLLVLMVRLRLEIWDAPVRIIAFVWWPVSIYLGWIIAATLANLSALSVSLSPGHAFALQPFWIMIMVGVAFIAYLLLIFYRNMREAAFAGIWALVAIAVKQWEVSGYVTYAALIAAVVILVMALLQAFRNMKTMPFNKIKRGEI